MKPNILIRFALWLCGYKWRRMEMYAKFDGNETLAVIGKKMI